MTKNIFITAIIALVVSLSVSSLRENQQSNVGGLSGRDISATSLKVGTPTARFNVNNAGTRVAVGTTTPSTLGDVIVDSTATTTLVLSSSTAGRGSCIQMETVTGGAVRIVVTGTTISATAGTCR